MNVKLASRNTKFRFPKKKKHKVSLKECGYRADTGKHKMSLGALSFQNVVQVVSFIRIFKHKYGGINIKKIPIEFEPALDTNSQSSKINS